MKKRTAVILISLVCLMAPLCLLLVRGGWALETVEDLPKAYAASLSHEETTSRITKYVIALDNSFSMDDAIKERNAAARALLYILPQEENVQATLFFFTNETRAPVDLLPMDQEEEREKLLELLDDNERAKGGTDLGEMMEKALEKFGDEQVGRRALFVVTDGGNDGTAEEIAAKDKKFFELCAQARDKVDIYIVYIPEDDSLDKLEKGLHTKKITLDEDSEDAVSRLTVWEEAESAKILSIPDIDNLDAALLNLSFSDADAVFNRRIEESGTVSFPIYSLCAQEITIAVSGGGSAEDDIRSVKVGGEGDLLRQDRVEFNGSMVTLRNREGLPAGLYTVEVSAEKPYSMVIACRYNYQIRYDLSETENREEPPAGLDAALQMLAVDPEGNELPADDSVALSMNVYGRDASGGYELLREVRNGDTFPGELLKAGVPLELRPVVAYGGIRQEKTRGWTIRPTDLPPTLKDRSIVKWMWLPGAEEIPLGKISDLAADRETPAEDILVSGVGESLTLNKEGDTILLVNEDAGDWIFWKIYQFGVEAEDASGQTAAAEWTVVALAGLPILVAVLGVVIAAILTVLTYIEIRDRRMQKRWAAKRRREELEEQKQLYWAELKIDQTFIRAGLCWTLQNNQKETTHIGGLGLTDEEGRLQGGCDLSKVPVYCLGDKDGVTDCQNPLAFGLWRYSEAHECTELLLRASPGITDLGGKALKRVVKTPEGIKEEGDIICFGVNRSHPYREVRLEMPEGVFTFRLEYYTDHPPFYL